MTVQPYRQIRPHIPAECRLCAPGAPGHQACQHDGCDEITEVQHRRHATQAEYNALPEHFKPVDGIAHQAVFVCLDHEADPICGDEHHQPSAPQTAEPGDAACPKCGTPTGLPCVKANGKPRNAPHAVCGQSAPPGPAPACNHVHRENCGGQGHCACRADDPAPTREPRIVPPPVPAAPAPIHVPTHGEVQHFLADNGIDVARVLTLEAVPSADGPIVLRAVLAVLDHHGNHVFDQHGQRVAEVREIRLTPTHSTDPVAFP